MRKRIGVGNRVVNSKEFIAGAVLCVKPNPVDIEPGWNVGFQGVNPEISDV